MKIVLFALLGVSAAYKCSEPAEIDWPDKVRICDNAFGQNPACDDIRYPYN